jgi:hypothetical protein
MKKFFFVAALVAIVSLYCFNANAEDSAPVSVENYSSSVVACIAGINEEINFDTRTLVHIYRLMPQKVQDLCVASYKAIAPRIERNGARSFTYEGVTITPVQNATGLDLKFTCQGHSLVVKNYSKAEFDAIFGVLE